MVSLENPKVSPFVRIHRIYRERTPTRMNSMLSRPLIVLTVACGTTFCFAADTHAPRVRIPWTTSHVVGTPDPPDPYVLENAFPGIKFESPLAVARIPGTNDFLIAEQFGRIVLLTTSPEPTTQLIVDTKRQLYGVVAHPDFASNGQIFIAGI